MVKGNGYPHQHIHRLIEDVEHVDAAMTGELIDVYLHHYPSIWLWFAYLHLYSPTH